jgi:hypothetical protein
MRNAIKFFYNIEVNDLIIKNDDFIFGNYILKKIDKKVDYSIYNFFIHNKLYIDKIIYNTFNEIESLIDKKKYILFKRERKVKLSFFEIISFFKKLEINQENNWPLLWKEKIDYYEKESIRIVNAEFRHIFPYYIGLSENAIKYYYENNGNYTICFSHNRLNDPVYFYCPNNIIIDCISRDIAEYIKYSFFEKKLDIHELQKNLNKINLTRDDAILLFSRLLFPTYFFDSIEFKTNFEIYSSRINQYEELLSIVFGLLNNTYKIPKIEWLIKKI